MSDEEPKPFEPVWEEPPAVSRPGRRGYDAELDAFVEALKLGEGRWARLTPAPGERDHPMARAVKLRKIDGLVVRTVTSEGGKSRCMIWARWAPGAEH